MRVRVIAVTTPVVHDLPDDPEALVAYCARVSNPAGQHAHDTAPRLLAYLRRNGHWSPFEMASAVVEVETTRDIARQLLRHRAMKFQEFSQRYAEVSAPPSWREARGAHPTNRQSSVRMGGWRAAAFAGLQRAAWLASAGAYRGALALGVAKEQARAVLPEGLTVSRLYAHADLRTWLHYCDLREGHGTQSEHAELARAIRAALAPWFPATMEADADV